MKARNQGWQQRWNRNLLAMMDDLDLLVSFCIARLIVYRTIGK